MSIAQEERFAAGVEIPTLRSDRVVHRRRLCDALDRALGQPDEQSSVVLICAPAGSGKSTLLADWAHRVVDEPGHPLVAWAALDDIHNTAANLRAELVRAVTGTSPPEIHKGDGPYFNDSRAQQLPISELLQRLDRPVWLILDDAHLLHEPDALSELEMLLRAPPAQLRVVVCGRFEPPLAFQKLRLDGRILDVTFDDLAFTAAEAAALLAEHGVALDAADLSALMERTEGWAAGLRLAGMSLAGNADASAMIENFTGCRRAVADYLIEQVLSGQSDEVRQFLVKTSVPATFSAALAEELTGCADAHAIIDLLEHRNFLITRVETTPALFRYHPLLRSYLRAEISLLGRRAVADLEHVTARWYARFGDALLSLEHAVTAGDVADVETVLSESGLGLVLDGHGDAVERLVAEAPRTIRDRPTTRLVRAAAYLHGDNPTVAEALLASIDGRPPLPGIDGRARVLVDALRLQYAVHAGDPARLHELSPGSDEVASGDHLLDAFVALQRGRVRLHVGELESAAEILQRAHAHARESDSAPLLTQTSTALGVVALCRGRIGEAGTWAAESRSAATVAASPGGADVRRTALLEALCHYLRNDTARAVELVGAADDTSSESVMARALFGIDTAPDRRAAVAALHAATVSGRPAAHPPGLLAACLPSIHFAYLHIGETTWAHELVATATRVLGRTGDVLLLEAVLHLCANQLERARSVLHPVLEGEIACAAATNTVTAWLVEAELAGRRAHEARAHEALGEALRLAEPEGVLRPFHDMTSASLDLLSANRGRFGPRDSFAATVWASLPRTAATTAEKLTRRELQLLAELPTWRTADEIAADLCVSVNTVKTHLRGIYRKLGVTTRRDAVTAAHTHGLL